MPTRSFSLPRRFDPRCALRAASPGWARLLAGLCLAGAASAACAQSWYIETASALLDPGNRFTGVLVATNRGDVPVYVRTSASRILIKDGKREQAADSAGIMRVYPEEFVLAPQSSFTVRLVAESGKIEGPGQSFYVRMTDVSNITASGQGGMSSSMLLAYDTLVAVSKSRPSVLSPEAFEIVLDGSGRPLLANRSIQHVFLQSGYRCADKQRQLVECEPMFPFPSQSMLPGEQLRLPALNAPFFGLLLQPTLTPRARPIALMIPAQRTLGDPPPTPSAPTPAP